MISGFTTQERKQTEYCKGKKKTVEIKVFSFNFSVFYPNQKLIGSLVTFLKMSSAERIKYERVPDLLCGQRVKPFPKRQILDSSKLKHFVDNNFELDENGRKFFIKVENTMGKGESAISPFPTVFLKDLYCRHKPGLVWATHFP